MADAGGPFRISSRDRLRASETVDDAWKAVSNDEFFALGLYVQAATGVGLAGYGREERPDATERMRRTLDELDSVLEVLNAAPDLQAASSHEQQGAATTLDVGLAIDDVVRALERRVSPGLSSRVEQELRAWATDLSDRPGPSDLIVYDGPGAAAAPWPGSGVSDVDAPAREAEATAEDDPQSTLPERPDAPGLGSGVSGVDAPARKAEATADDDPQPTLPVRPGAAELVELAARIAWSRDADAVGPIDVVVAGKVRPHYTKLNPERLRDGATYSVYEADLATVRSALRTIGGDLAAVESATPPGTAADLAARFLEPDGGMLGATTLARRVGAKAVFAHHVLADALLGDLPDAALTELRCTREQLRVALRLGISERWAETEDAGEWDEILGSALVDGEFSAGVREVRRRLGPSAQVTASSVVRELQRDHPDYGAGRFEKAEIQDERGRLRPTDSWLLAARHAYDWSEVVASTHGIIDGRLLAVALAELDQGVRESLEPGGLLEALRNEVEVVPRVGSIESPEQELQGPLLAGATADTVPEPGDGRVRAADRLNTAAEVEMIVSVLLARDTPLPLAVALLGDWGSGKSFFMALMQERMAELSALAAGGAPEAAPFCKQVRAVRFNAWHYVDTELWPSLAATLFDELARDDQRDEAAETLTAIDRAVRELEAARREREDVERKVREVQKRVPSTRATVESAIEAVRNDTELRQKLELAKEQPGDRAAEDLVATVGSVSGIAERTVAVWRLARDEARRRRRGPTALTLVVFVSIAVLVWALTEWDLAVKMVAAVAAVAGALGPALHGAQRTLQLARAARIARERPLREQEQALADAEEEERRRSVELGELRAELRTLRSQGDRFREFVSERAASGDYRERLGVISQLRRDFEQLTDLLPSASPERVDRASGSEVVATVAAFSEDLPGVERIVLYIDDLDRCPRDRVVEVLQAVHLLLAFKLFVVVVGVDSRWLERSLASHYDKLLDEPDDYLEKIFQISFTLRKMTPTQFTDLVDGLAPTAPTATDRPDADESEPTGAKRSSAAPADADGDHGAVGGDEAARSDPGEGDGSIGRSEPPTETVDLASVAVADLPARPNPKALEISDEERILLGRLAGIVPTPRAVKRLMNTYRMLRVSVPDDERRTFQPHQGDEYQALVVLLGLLVGKPDLANDVFATILSARADADVWQELRVVEGAMDVLEPLRAHVTISTCEPYQRWVPRVARFSFRCMSVTLPAPSSA